MLLKTHGHTYLIPMAYLGDDTATRARLSLLHLPILRKAPHLAQVGVTAKPQTIWGVG